MKRLVFIVSLLLFGNNCAAQNLYLKIYGNSEPENKTIDSIGYLSKHNEAKSIFAEGNLLANKLTRIGYIENQIKETIKLNDSSFQFKFILGKKTEFIHIYIGKESILKKLSIIDSEKDTIKMLFSEAEGFLKQTLTQLENKGYSLTKLKLIDFTKKNNSLFATLFIDTGQIRQLNDIVIKGYDKFPEGHKKSIKRLYKNKIFNQENLKKIHAAFEKFRFVKQIKYPEILFTKDTTKLYVYLEKSKPNKFDGYIGFANDEKTNLIFNGYLDLLLINNLNSGEELSLYWKSDGKEQKTFNIGIELPYLFKTPFGLKANLNIFKQDSTYQNTKTGFDIGYFFNYNSRIYLGYQSTESSDIQNQNSTSLSDFKSSFTTTNYEYSSFNNDDLLFPEKTKINFKIGYGSRNSKIISNRQTFANLDLKHQITLNKKNSLNLRTQNFYLQSDKYITNELFRFGGINSIRGFNENNLQANLFTSLLTEYRFAIASNLYLHSIMDYGYYEDKTIKSKGNLLGLGFGFGLLTKNGLLNLAYANGSTKEQTVKLSNSIVHISFKAIF
ncbi:MAG: hypothetical protein V4548_09635 [Bacteroidota bacterium]